MTTVAPHINTISPTSTYFVNIGSLQGKVAQLVGGSIVPAASYPSFSTATWANSATGGVSTVLQTPGAAILRDLGKTIVSSLRTFRKVQLVVSSVSSGPTIGSVVASQNGTNLWNVGGPVLGEEYYTGYIELPGQFGNTGAGTNGLFTQSLFNIAPVARLG